MKKEIKRNRATHDYDMFIDGRYIGSRATHREAELELDRIVLATLQHS